VSQATPHVRVVAWGRRMGDEVSRFGEESNEDRQRRLVAGSFFPAPGLTARGQFLVSSDSQAARRSS
jgi:hypothetical protein